MCHDIADPAEPADLAEPATEAGVATIVMSIAMWDPSEARRIPILLLRPHCCHELTGRFPAVVDGVFACRVVGSFGVVAPDLVGCVDAGDGWVDGVGCVFTLGWVTVVRSSGRVVAGVVVGRGEVVVSSSWGRSVLCGSDVTTDDGGSSFPWPPPGGEVVLEPPPGPFPPAGGDVVLEPPPGPLLPLLAPPLSAAALPTGWVTSATAKAKAATNVRRRKTRRRQTTPVAHSRIATIRLTFEPPSGLDAVVDADAAKNTGEVRFDRLLGDAETTGDELVRHAQCDERERVSFTVGQRDRCLLLGVRRAADDEHGCFRVQGQLAACRRPDAARELFRRCVLHQVPHRTSLEGTHDPLTIKE